MAKPQTPPHGRTKIGRYRDIEEKIHDPYQAQQKLKEPTVCPDCRAVFADGRWQWADVPAGADEHRCPACQRIHDHYPAGYLELSGDYFAQHREEILGLLRHHAERANREHPLQKIMEIEDAGDQMTITTTELHLARGLGEAVQHAHKGDLDLHYSKDQTQVRLRWRR